MRGALLVPISFAVACSSTPTKLPPLPPPAPTVPEPVRHEPVQSQHSAAKPERSTEPSATNLDWGTAHPVLVAAADPGRRWLAVCQARDDTDGNGKITVAVGTQGERTGDALSGYFILRGGPGERIDAFVGADPSGRYVVFVREHALWLVDVLSGTRTNLSATGADLRDDGSLFFSHRAAAFSPNGDRLLYFRGPSEPQRVVVRELSTGAETVVEPGDGLLWRANFAPDGEQVILWVVTDDTSKNGKVEWQVRPASEQRMRCPASIPRLSVWEYPGDRAHARLAPSHGGAAKDAPHLVVALRAAGVERQPDQSLLWRLADGSSRPLASSKCEARLVHADFERSLVIITCKDPKTGRHRLLVRGVTFEERLELEAVTANADFWLEGSPRFVPLHAGRNTALYDAETRKIAMLLPGDRIVATHGDRALLVRGDALVLWDRERGTVDLGARMAPFGRLLHAGPLVAALPWLVDLSSGALVGKLSEDTIAVSSDGMGLAPLGDPGDADRPALGPLRWLPAVRTSQ